MTGFLLIATLALWTIAAWLASGWVVKSLRANWLKVCTRLLVFSGLMICLVVDEIVGGLQFKSLCEREAVLKVSAEKVRGRTLKQISLQSFPVDTILRIEQWRNSFVDATSGEEMASFSWLRTSGGWFIRTLGISEGDAPLLIHPSTCWPVMQGRLSETYQFTLIKD